MPVRVGKTKFIIFTAHREGLQEGMGVGLNQAGRGLKQRKAEQEAKRGL